MNDVINYVMNYGITCMTMSAFLTSENELTSSSRVYQCLGYGCDDFFAGFVPLKLFSKYHGKKFTANQKSVKNMTSNGCDRDRPRDKIFEHSSKWTISVTSF